ncbi:MAG TPA: hypothetical protein VGB59_07765 [Allosphingosinicella sp.]|jgi:hypothetical protein
MKKSLLALLLLAACGGTDESAQNGAGGTAAGGKAGSPDGAATEKGSEVTEQAVATARLTGLYEGGSGPQKNQLCVIDRGSGDAQFGLVVWGPQLRSCSGAGQAVRSGDRLTLTMSGDQACVVEGRIQGGNITLVRGLSPGCRDYYCGSGAQLDGASFTRRGSTAEDALKARDIAGDPLCG